MSNKEVYGNDVTANEQTAALGDGIGEFNKTGTSSWIAAEYLKTVVNIVCYALCAKWQPRFVADSF